MRTWITLVKRSMQSFGSDKCATFAAAIAYYTVFALFPIALVGVSILGFFVSDAAAQQYVVNVLASVFSISDASKASLAQTLADLSQAKGLLGLIGLLTALWAASGLFGSIRRGLDSVWDVERPLPWLRATARDLTLFAISGSLLVASTISTALLQILAGPLDGLLSVLMPPLFTFAGLLVLYRLAPHARLQWADVWPAALITTIAFDFGKDLLILYLRHVSSLNLLAGFLGGAILFLVFVYYASQVILFSAEFAKHRMLVNTGAVPATDRLSRAAAVPLRVKGRGTLLRLWQVGHPHHDTGLPYAPGRLDPTASRPTNTRERVLYKLREAEANARRSRAVVYPNGDGSDTGQSLPSTSGSSSFGISVVAGSTPGT
jgi:membrane protein